MSYLGSPTDHAAALTALIDAAALPFAVYPGEVPEAASAPYAVLYAGPGVASRTTLASKSDTLDFAFQITSVGEGQTQAVDVAGRCREALIDRRPVVAGRGTSPVTHRASQPPRRDDDVQPAVFVATDQYGFFSTPLAST